MLSDELAATLAGASVAVVLGMLVVASFTLIPTGGRSTVAVTVGPDTADRAAFAEVARADAVARGLVGVMRDLPSTFAVTTTNTAGWDVLLTTSQLLRAPAPAAAEPTPVEPEPAPAPAPTPRPTARPSAPPRTPAPAPIVAADVASAEQRMLALMNASRAAGGLAPLAMDAGVAAVARLHSLAESQVGYVYHDGPDGTAKSRNVPACGTGWYGENTGKIWDMNVDRLHIEFMNEPWEPVNHRTNIMDPNFKRVGVGAVQGRDALYMTMVFCR